MSAVVTSHIDSVRTEWSPVQAELMLTHVVGCWGSVLTKLC